MPYKPHQCPQKQRHHWMGQNLTLQNCGLTPKSTSSESFPVMQWEILYPGSVDLQSVEPVRRVVTMDCRIVWLLWIKITVTVYRWGSKAIGLLLQAKYPRCMTYSTTAHHRHFINSWFLCTFEQYKWMNEKISATFTALGYTRAKVTCFSVLTCTENNLWENWKYISNSTERVNLTK